MATEETLRMTEMAIKANNTCSVFGKQVVLNGLSKAEYNGMVGTLGGYVAESDRRVVYPAPGSPVDHELSIKLENVFVELPGVDGETQQVCILERCSATTNLVDVRDRLGSISLHEVVSFNIVTLASIIGVV